MTCEVCCENLWQKKSKEAKRSTAVMESVSLGQFTSSTTHPDCMCKFKTKDYDCTILHLDVVSFLP